MRSYQSVLILKPDYDDTQVQQNTESISELIKGQGGSCLKIDNWGKKRLAYKVKKNRFGIYLNIYHTCESLNVSALEEKYRLYDPIIKYIVIKLDDKDIQRVLEDKPEDSEKDSDSKGSKEDKEVKAVKEDIEDKEVKAGIEDKEVKEESSDKGEGS